LCAALLLASPPTAAGSSYAPSPKKGSETIPLKIKATEVKKPPYVVTLEAELRGEHPTGFTYHMIKLVGKKDGVGDEKVTGDGWEFTLYIDYIFQNDTVPADMMPPMTKIFYSEIQRQHEVITGKGKAVVTDNGGKTGDEYGEFEQAKKKADEKKQKREKATKLLRRYWNGEISYEEMKEEMKQDLMKSAQASTGPKTAYKAEFTIKGTGVRQPDSSIGAITAMETVTGASVTTPIAEPGNDSLYYMIGERDYKVELTIDDKNVAKAKMTFIDYEGNTETRQLEGTFTCVRDIDVKMSASIEFPIWDTWTDKDIYAPLPKILKDHEKRYAQLQARQKDPSAKVDTLLYNEGKWIALNKGKKLKRTSPLDPKNAPNTYEMAEIAEEYILYEKGEIWMLGDLVLRPTESYRFPRDHQDNMALYAQELAIYAQPLYDTVFRPSYSFVSDGLYPLLGFFMGVPLRRVRAGMVCETWSSVEGVEKPDAKKLRDTAGVWYEFKLQKGQYVDKKDEDGNVVRDESGATLKEYMPPKVGGYTWERVTVKSDGTAEVLSGMADIDSFDSALCCYIEKRTSIDRAGKATEEAYGPAPADDENEDGEDDFDYEQITLAWSDYDKAAGQITINGTRFYKVTKSALNGSWSTHSDAPPTPDASKAEVRDAIKANYPGPVDWIKLESPKREFTRVSWMCGEGLLIEMGTYKTLDFGRLVFENIKGTYYDGDGTLVFKDEDCGRQSDVFDYDEPVDGVMYISGIGKMYKAK
jgi:hypothetical protein